MRRGRKHLREVEPEGRLDVLAFNLIRGVVKGAERKYGIEGVWDEIEDGIEHAIRGQIPGNRYPVRPFLKQLETRARMGKGLS